jgi:uncharacterized protein YjbI with pentapeptide repeats
VAEETEIKKLEKPAQPANNGWQIINLDALKNPPVWLAVVVHVLAGLLALAVLFLVAVGLFATFQIAYESVTGELNDRVEAAKVFFPILLALVGGPLLIWRVVTAHVQATAARHQANVAQEGFYTSLFTKAVEQLGATREVKTYQEVDDGAGGKKREAVTKTEPNLEVRLGAIYALDRIARDSERDHWPIMEVFCAYIRNPQNCGSPVPLPGAEGSAAKTFQNWLPLVEPRTDVQAAITVIGRRSVARIAYERKHGFSLDLSEANLQRSAMTNCDFSNANMNGATLDGAVLGFAHMEAVRFGGASLQRATFEGAFLNYAMFPGAALQNANLNSATLKGVWFDGANLSGATFIGADLEKSILERAIVSRANFSNSNLNEVSFQQTRFSHSPYRDDVPNFFGAKFGSWNEESSRFKGAEVFNLDFTKSSGLATLDLIDAFGDATTMLPPGIDPPKSWPKEVLDPYQRIDMVYGKSAR